MESTKVLIIVDVQYDFCEGGSLAVQEASQIIPYINSLRQKFQTVVVTSDWHPKDHVSFASNHPNSKPFTNITINGQVQELWPDHCVQNTHGSELHKDLVVKDADIFIKKGTSANKDAYSGFDGTDLHQQTKLSALNVKQVYVVGLAYDFCVKATAISAFKLGYQVRIIEAGTKAIDKNTAKGNVEQAKKKAMEEDKQLQEEQFEILKEY